MLTGASRSTVQLLSWHYDYQWLQATIPLGFDHSAVWWEEGEEGRGRRGEGEERGERKEVNEDGGKKDGS